MRDRKDPWKWPFAWGLALTLVLGFFVYIPASWLEGSGNNSQAYQDELSHGKWLILSAPPEILVIPPEPEDQQEDQPEPKSIVDQSKWWTEAWQVRTEITVVDDLTGPRSQPTDSLDIFLQELGLGREIFELARPDSILAARLVLLRRQESWEFDHMKPYLEGLTRSRAYADILSRAADMYGDFLQSEIMTPD